MTGQRLTPLEMLARLVAFNTISSCSNLELISFVEAYLQGWGVVSQRIPNAAGDKAALFATIGPQDRGGVVLSGHTDVVPVDGQIWASDPFSLHVKNGRAYGRGAVDMKGFARLCSHLYQIFSQLGWLLLFIFSSHMMRRLLALVWWMELRDLGAICHNQLR
jgi:acetylornithine deacetylase